MNRSSTLTAVEMEAEQKYSVFLSVVIPAFNEAENLPSLITRLTSELSRYPSYEILIVDDGSTDDTLAVLEILAHQDEHIRYLGFSRNFGHQSALRAGMEYSCGAAVICMDADLQHPPEMIHALVDRWRDGNEIVITIRDEPEDISKFKQITSKIFYRMLNWLAEFPLSPGAADFRLLDRVVVKALFRFADAEIFFRGIIPMLGFRTTQIHYVPDSRLHGTSKYSLKKMLRLAISGVVSCSTRPLRIAMVMALVMAMATLVEMAYSAVMYIVGGTVPGWTSTVLLISLFSFMQFLVLSVFGEYLAQILRETRRRPAFLIRRTNIPGDLP